MSNLYELIGVDFIY